jgi:hypothetical protein
VPYAGKAGSFPLVPFFFAALARHARRTFNESNPTPNHRTVNYRGGIITRERDHLWDSRTPKPEAPAAEVLSLDFVT